VVVRYQPLRSHTDPQERVQRVILRLPRWPMSAHVRATNQLAGVLCACVDIECAGV